MTIAVLAGLRGSPGHGAAGRWALPPSLVLGAVIVACVLTRAGAAPLDARPHAARHSRGHRRAARPDSAYSGAESAPAVCGSGTGGE